LSEFVGSPLEAIDRALRFDHVCRPIGDLEDFVGDQVGLKLALDPPGDFVGFLGLAGHAMMLTFQTGMTNGFAFRYRRDRGVCVHRLLPENSTDAAVRSDRHHGAHCVRADFHLPLRPPCANYDESTDGAWLLRDDRAFAVRLDRSDCLAEVIATTSLATAALQAMGG
jgi:hypothetical protein